MFFRQLFDAESWTYTYLIGDPDTGKAILIDPVDTHVQSYIDLLDELELTLDYSLETHVHADHITGSGLLREKLGCESVIHSKANVPCISKAIEDGETLGFGKMTVQSLFTPGHTDHHVAYLVNDRLFTGDSLFINGCGRTDFQSGSSEELWDSVQEKLFSLPTDTLVYPGHDYRDHHVSTILQEKKLNPRFAGQTKESFVDLMSNLDLPHPKKIMEAVPANMVCGLKID